MSIKKRSIFDEDYNEGQSTEKVLKKNTDESQKCLESKSPSSSTLTPAQLAKIEQNRQHALLIRLDKINKKTPYTKRAADDNTKQNKVIKIDDKKLIDSGAGFFIDPEENKHVEAAVTVEPAPLFEEDKPFCLECDTPFNNSFLHDKFLHSVCDQCRNDDDRHMLITKTDAKNEYLLKDVDFDVREPPLKYIVRKNPHNSQWGDMKLYLKLQVEKRALEVWKTEEALEEALEIKEQQREKNKQKKFKKKMQELRMDVRSSLYTRAKKFHEHEYEEEVYYPDDDEYSQTCKICGHTFKYDKL